MSAVKSDTSMLSALSDSIGYLHSDLKKLTYMYYLEIKGICDPEQQKKLEQLFGEAFSNDASTGTRAGERSVAGNTDDSLIIDN